MAQISPYLLMGPFAEDAYKKDVFDDGVLSLDPLKNQNPYVPVDYFGSDMIPQFPQQAIEAYQQPNTQSNKNLVVNSNPTQQDVSAVSSYQVNNPSMKTLIDDLSSNYDEAIKAQKDAISQAESRLKSAQSSKANINLAPLAALVDSWTGSKFSSTYQPPESKAKQVEQLQDAVLKARLGLSQTELDRYNKMLGIKESGLQRESNERIAGLRLAASGESSNTRQNVAEEKLQTDAEESYEKDYGISIVSIAKIARKATQLKSVLNTSGDPLWGASKGTINALSSSLATDYNRDIGKLGALAGADLKLITAATGQGLSLEDYITRQLNGGVETRKALLDMMIEDANTAVSIAEGKVKSQANYNRVEKKLNNDLNTYRKSVAPKQGEKPKKTMEEMLKLKEDDPAEYERILSEDEQARAGSK